jgi:hypothetical protein
MLNSPHSAAAILGALAVIAAAESQSFRFIIIVFSRFIYTFPAGCTQALHKAAL